MHKFGSFKGHTTVTIGDGKRPACFGLTKARALVKMVDGGLSAQTACEVAQAFGLYQLEKESPEEVIAAAQALIARCETEGEREAA